MRRELLNKFGDKESKFGGRVINRMLKMLNITRKKC
jgi:hypothetical protein